MEPVQASRVVAGLESIIDAAAGVLSEQSLEATLRRMARALGDIVPYTSLAVYELDLGGRRLVPVFALGRYVEETLAFAPPLDDSISGSAVLSGELVHLEPGDPLLGEYQIPDTPDESEAFIVAPLMAAGRPLGSLNVWREDVAPTFAAEEAQLIRRFATLAAMAYDNARQRERLREQAHTDELTGLFNRRHFHERLAEELARLRREDAPVALVLLDVDDFKRVNDHHGHPAGDAVLRRFAEVLSREVRTCDVVCRTGGEEFAVILPGAGPGEAALCGERLVAQIRAGEPLFDAHITASAGVASAPADAATVAGLFRVADDRLLAAKAAGKDRVVMAGPAPAA